VSATCYNALEKDEVAMSTAIINRGRGPEIAGTRITVYDILDYTTADWHHTAIAATLRLSSAQVLAAIEYIEKHKDEVMPVYQQILERAAQGNSPEIQAKADAAHAKFLKLLNPEQLAYLQELNGEGNSRGQ
jgi:uncharacterized protein (DUF433 family)